MDENPKRPVSKYLGTFFGDGAQKSGTKPGESSDSSRLPPKKSVNSSKSVPSTSAQSESVDIYKGIVEDIWGNDFPEDFSEDCIILDSKSAEVKDTSASVCVIDKPIYIKSSDDNDVQIISSNSDSTDSKRDKGPVEKKKVDDVVEVPSQLPNKSYAVASTSKSIPSTSSSQSFTTEWLRNQLEKVNKEYSSLKEALIAKDGESSLLRGKLRDAEQEIQKIKQQWQAASSKERSKFEEQIKLLEKQLNTAKTQILFKSKEAESNLERYLEVKRLSIKDPEFTQVKSSCSRFKTFSNVAEPPAVHEQTDDLNKKSEIPIKKNVDDEILKLDSKLNLGKELEFYIHPDLFIESALEFNFVIPPSTDYYPFNVMYKDIKEMPADDSSCEPLNLYNIWKVKRESFGEIMSNVIDITNDNDSDSDSDLALKSVNDDFPSSKAIKSKEEIEDKSSFEKEKDSDKTTPPNYNLEKNKGSHPRLMYLGKSRYFTSLREIHLPLIEMCKSYSWEQKAIDEVFKHVKNMTRELYVAMCDPSVDAYFSTMNLRDNQIIDSCSDMSELKMEYNIFSPKKWRDKEIYVDLRRGIALIKVLCDLDPRCMEVVLNSALNKLPGEFPAKTPKTTPYNKGKKSSCCSKNVSKQPSDSTKKQLKSAVNESNKKEINIAEGVKKPFQKSANKRRKGQGDERRLKKLPKVRKKKGIKKEQSKPPIIELSSSTDEEEPNVNQPPKKSNEESSLNEKQKCVNPLPGDLNSDIQKEGILNPRQVEEQSHKHPEGLKPIENIEETINMELSDNEKENNEQLSILDKTINNEQKGWVEAIKAPLLVINDKPSTKEIIALRDNACCSEAEKEFLSCALSTFSKIKANMKSGLNSEEDKGRKRKLSEDIAGHSKKLALDVLYEKEEVAEGSATIDLESKLISENIKPMGSSFSFRKKRDVQPLRKTFRDEPIPGTSKDEPNLDQEIEMEIQKIFNEPAEPKPEEKKKGKAKEIESFNCDNLAKTDRLKYFNILAHSGDFLVLLFEIIREIGRKIYTTNFNYMFAVTINLVHTLLKNGNPGLIQRHFLFDILQEILYCRPSPIALLQMNKLLVDVIPFQPFLTSLMCHNANSNHMVLDSEPVYFTRGACFIEVISGLVDYFMNESDWEIQTYCVRWLSYMYLIEKTTIEEWYLLQKTVCRRCHCIVMLTNMAVKIFETASSYYLRCCIENRLTYLLSCQLLEIIQSGVKILYVMIDFDKYFSENIGERYGMFLRFLDTVKLIHRSPDQFKEFNSNKKDLDIVQLLLIEEKVADSIAKTSKTPETINEMADLFSTFTDWPPKSFQGDKLFLSELSD